jgi:hypothetical protein
MILPYLLLAYAAIGATDLSSSLSTMRQLYEYQVAITPLKAEGTVQITANPAAEGSATAWLYVDEKIEIAASDTLVMTVAVNSNTLRIKWMYYRMSTQAYWGNVETVAPKKGIQTIRIPVKKACAFYNGNYPFALTPGKTPALFVFFDNLLPGKFDATISSVSVVPATTGGAR